MKKTGLTTVVSAKTHEAVKKELERTNNDLNASEANRLNLKAKVFMLESSKQDKFFANLHFTTPTGKRLRWERKNGCLGTLCEINGTEVAIVMAIETCAIAIRSKGLVKSECEFIEFSHMDFNAQ